MRFRGSMVAGLAAALAAVSAARAAAPESRVHVFPAQGGELRGIETTVTERLTTAKSIAEKE